ncbi:MAG: hypothetical protein KC912_05875 [Proteobacteria bacterium]|nr:hypothetical protein [Pseudomonadota bacterium]
MRHVLLLLALGACQPDPIVDVGVDTDRVGGVLDGPAVVRIAAVETGGVPSEANLVITSTGPTSPLAADVEGPFEIEGSWGGFVDGEESRSFRLSFTGSTDVVGHHVGSAAFTDGEQVVEVALAAAVVSADLPDDVIWTDDGHGVSAFAAMPSAPFPVDGGQWTDPTVWIWIPDGLEAPFATVTHLHGHNAVVADMLSTKHLPDLFAVAGRNAVVIVPQGPVSAASGDFGKLMQDGGHAALVQDVVGLLYRDALVDLPKTEGVVLTSHSGGYRATARIIEDGGLPVDQAHLYDSLYGQSATFESFALRGGVLRSNYTTSGGTGANNTALASALSSAGESVSDDFSDAGLRGSSISIGWTPATHAEVMRDDRNMQRWLEVALAPHRHRSPELLAAVHEGATASVVWRDEGREVVIEGSSDGVSWSELGAATGGTATVDGAAHLRVRTAESLPSDVYSAQGSDWLVVDGFDRFIGGSYGEHTHGFAGRIGAALGQASSASNEAVVEGLVDLDDFGAVVWLLGDESSADRTFTEVEQSVLAAYVSGGGKLIVSGAEVGFATDTAFLNGTLGATFVSDNAGSTVAGGFEFGVAYPEDYPDVLSGGATLWAYSTGGAAAVVSNAQVVTVGFPIETLAESDLVAALTELREAIGR